jgi:hypothetical protein
MSQSASEIIPPGKPTSIPQSANKSEIAGKLFVAASFAMMLGGTICLHRVTFEKSSLWPFLAIVLLYNRLLLVGLLNCLLGLAYAHRFYPCGFTCVLGGL